jgi:hypothetical protein
MSAFPGLNGRGWVIPALPIWGHDGGMKTSLVREKLTLRLPPDLRRRLKSVAVVNGRSLNAEIIQRLGRSFDGGSDAPQGSELQ